MLLLGSTIDGFSWWILPAGNFLLDSELSISSCDFTESAILPLSTCMKTADGGAYSIQTDIEQLGAVVYGVIGT